MRRRATIVKRRDALAASALSALTGCGGRSLEVSLGDTPEAEDTRLCRVRPVQTEGPYFVDEMLERSDITSDPETGEIKTGVPLRVLIHVLTERDRACAPVVGATVDLWQCDALGTYGDVLDSGGAFDTRGQRWLRGHQFTTPSGSVEFRTIYPGWYTGRTVHLHFKVRTNSETGLALTYTSQLYFDDTVTDRVMLADPYATRAARGVTNEGDSIFLSAGGADLVLALRDEAEGYVGEIHIGLAGA